MDRQGIRAITPQEISRSAGVAAVGSWSARPNEPDVEGRAARDGPARSPLYHVEGTSSTITFETDVLGPLSIVETNGADTTAYGPLADFPQYCKRIISIMKINCQPGWA
jgi:homoserine dehydrogenase